MVSRYGYSLTMLRMKKKIKIAFIYFKFITPPPLIAETVWPLPMLKDYTSYC
jgi:hypothetical protein